MSAAKIEQPLVSVIMPTYNHARFIGEAIDSVLNQTYSNLELIIIDNYSEDNTEEIVMSYHDESTKYLKFRNHGVIAASRNYGIMHAQGDYIAFLDSDDLWKPTKVEKQVQFLGKNQNIFLVYSRYSVIKNGEILKILPDKKYLKSGNVFIPLFLSNNFIGISTMMLRNVLKEENFLFDIDINYKAIEDYDLCLRIAKTKEISYIDESLAVYRLHGNNTSYGIKPFLLRYLKLIKKYHNDVNKTLLIKKYLSIFATVCLLMIRKLCKKG